MLAICRDKESVDYEDRESRFHEGAADSLGGHRAVRAKAALGGPLGTTVG